MRHYHVKPGLFDGRSDVPVWVRHVQDLTRREKDLFSLMYSLARKRERLGQYHVGFWSLDYLGEMLLRKVHRPGELMSRRYLERLMDRLRKKDYVWTWRLRCKTSDGNHLSTNFHALRDTSDMKLRFQMACNSNINARRINLYMSRTGSQLRAMG